MRMTSLLVYGLFWPFLVLGRFLGFVFFLLGYPLRVALNLVTGSLALILPLLLLGGLLFAIVYYLSVALDGFW